MALILTSSGGYTRFDSAAVGSHYQISHTPDAGNTNAFGHSGDFWLQSGGDISSSTDTGGVKFYGKNGRTHYTHVAIGNDSGIFPSTQVRGIKFKAAQNSGAGHGIYIRRWGYSLRSKTSSSSWFYGVSGNIDRGSYGTKSYSHSFTSDALSKLSNGWVFNELHLGVTTEGGSGDRTTQVLVYDFQFNFVSPPSDKTLIVPARRGYSDRGQYPIA